MSAAIRRVIHRIRYWYSPSYRLRVAGENMMREMKRSMDENWPSSGDAR